MSASYSIHRDLRLVVSTGSDSVSWSDVKSCQDQTCADPAFRSDFDQIVDMRTVTGFEMTFDQVRTLARRRIFSSRSKRAFVSSSPSVFGMGRMWQTLVEVSDHPSQVQVFCDLGPALRWLGLKVMPSSIGPEPSRSDAHDDVRVEMEES